MEFSRWQAIVVVTFLILPLFQSVTPMPLSQESSITQTNIREDHSEAYTQHAPIIIDSKSDWKDQGWPGEGTEMNPYRIENLNITDTGNCINISNTNVHFLVNSCYLSGTPEKAKHAIHLQNVSYATIKGCTGSLKNRGIVLQSCHKCSIEKNDLRLTNQSGILINNSTHCYLLENTVLSANAYGMHFENSTQCTIANNLVSRNLYDGISIARGDRFTLANNSAYRNVRTGYTLQDVSNSVLINETISSNSDEGVMLSECDNVTITNCTATFNNYAGISISSSSNIEVSENTQIDNRGNGISMYDSSSIWINDTDVLENEGDGMMIEYCEAITVAGSSLKNNEYTGMHLYESTNCTIQNIYVRTNVWDGVYVERSPYCTITGSKFIINGIGLYRSEQAEIYDNTILGSGLRISANQISHSLHDVHNNTVNSKSLGYIANTEDTTIYAESYGQLILANCTGVTISGGEFINTSQGCTVAFSSLCDIMHTEARNNTHHGFFLHDSTNCSFQDVNSVFNSYEGFYLRDNIGTQFQNCEADDNGWSGFYIRNGDGARFSGCQATRNSDAGFDVYASTNCVLERNRAWGNGDNGIEFATSTSCEVTDNHVYQNSGHGFGLSSTMWTLFRNNTSANNNLNGFNLYDCTQCILQDNTIMNNDRMGVQIWMGSDNNVIFANDIHGNSQNAEDNGTDNSWYESGVGNKWGDYDGEGYYYIPGSAGSIDVYPEGFSSGPDTFPFEVASVLRVVALVATAGIVAAIVGKEVYEYRSASESKKEEHLLHQYNRTEIGWRPCHI
ncbi:MAG: hypothetical protein GF309_01970 [Candidatus Lokiarchaeota archaeon]|nr:hypothetical protein [Candidatus Lokiarchaeota archaeon]